MFHKKFYILFAVKVDINPCISHQGTTTEEDHEDDEGLKPVVLYNQVAGLSQEPPGFPPAHCDIDITAFVLCHAR